MSINKHGYNEACWGSLAQWQTLNEPSKDTQPMYAGFSRLDWHPYEDLPRMPLDERYQSFADRLAKFQSARKRCYPDAEDPSWQHKEVSVAITVSNAEIDKEASSIGMTRSEFLEALSKAF